MQGFLVPQFVGGIDNTTESRVQEWIGFSQIYFRASVVVQAESKFKTPASIYLSGHGIECAIKACIIAGGEDPPKTHDLVSLMARAEEKGYRAWEGDLWDIVRLNWYTFADPEKKARLKARYPLEHPKMDAMAPPDAIETVRAGSELLAQAARQIEMEFSAIALRTEMLQIFVAVSAPLTATRPT